MDVVGDRPISCAGRTIRLITLGPELTGQAQALTYARDPDMVLQPRREAERFDADAEIPTFTTSPGLRSQGADFFIVPIHPFSLYVRTQDHVERWPSVEPPHCD
jgi:hypothetical protein